MRLSNFFRKHRGFDARWGPRRWNLATFATSARSWLRGVDGGFGMIEIELTPDPHLLESMRAVGYSFETAVADVVDNSIAAHASTIHVLSTPHGDPTRVDL